ncbi:MAG: WD40/YVTN/BNR-like repeat-containing protein [Nitrososphaera sp.]
MVQLGNLLSTYLRADVGASTPQVISAGGNVYVVWEGENEGNYEIYIRRSIDKGATWKPIFNLSSNPGPSTGEEVAVSGSNVYVVWGQIKSGGGLSDIFFSGSVDGGATWKPFKNLSQNSHSRGPQVAASDSSVYAAWIDYGGNNEDISFRRSTDKGATWTAVQELCNNIGVSIEPRIGV